MRFGLVVTFYFIGAAVLLNPIMTSAQSQIGVESTVIDMGVVERDSENIATFRLVTTTSESFLVSLSKEPGYTDFFMRPGYKEILSNYSEEDVMGWVELADNYAELETVDGGVVGAQKEVSFVVNVPEDAEPGYHLFRIKPVPVFTQESLGQVGTRVVSITGVNFLLNVEGNAVRDGVILDVVFKNFAVNRLLTNTYFQNTGTTTMTVRAYQTIHRGGEFVEGSESAQELVKPGRMIALSVPFTAARFLEGDYDVSTTVDFLTGTVSKNTTMTITIPPPAPEEAEEKPSFPWFIIILLIIVVIAVLIYKWEP
jgi:hypothetical protein